MVRYLWDTVVREYLLNDVASVWYRYSAPCVFFINAANILLSHICSSYLMMSVKLKEYGSVKNAFGVKCGARGGVRRFPLIKPFIKLFSGVSFFVF